MEFQLQSPKTLTVRQPEVVTLEKVTIQRVLDDPIQKKVIVWLEGLQHPVELGDLSNENYDNPQWNNESLLASVQAFIAGLPDTTV
jgi:hypothetical protein